MRFAVLIFLVGLLVGCGGQKPGAIDLCIEDLAIYENFPNSASSFDKSKAEAMARKSCEPLVENDNSYKKLAIERFKKTFPDQNAIRVLEFQIRRNEYAGYDTVVIKYVENNNPEKKMIFDASLGGEKFEWDIGYGEAIDQK